MTTAQDAVQMRASQLITLLMGAIPARLPVLVTGAPGVGKSDVIDYVTDQLSQNLLICHPVVSDPTDFKGMPVADLENMIGRWLPFGDLAEIINAIEPMTVLFDDIGQAPPAVQAALMQLLLARRIGDHKVPDCVTFVAATNRRSDNAGVTGMLEPVKSRFATIVELVPHIDDWTQWAVDHGIRAEVIAFLRFRPELLSKFDPSRDMEQSPMPRTWARVSALLDLDLPNDVLMATLAGAVGAGAATEFWAFLDMYRHLPNVDAILINPTTAPIPSEPSALYAVSTALASKASSGTADAILEYSERLHDAGSGEFAALLVKDAQRRAPEITDTQAFQRFASGALAQLLHGAS